MGLCLGEQRSDVAGCRLNIVEGILQRSHLGVQSIIGIDIGRCLTLPVVDNVIEFNFCRNLIGIRGLVSNSGAGLIGSIAGRSGLRNLQVDVIVQVSLGSVKQVSGSSYKSLFQFSNGSVVLSLDCRDCGVYAVVSLLVLVGSLCLGSFVSQCIDFFLNSRFLSIELVLLIVVIA